MNSSKSEISIVTPSYNQGEFLEETIRSVVDQPCSNYILRYHIQDNCSVDSTHQVLEKYRHLEREIRIFVEPDAGQADALSRGFNSVGGEILGWINSDDVYLPGAFEAIVQTFEANSDIDVVYGGAYFIDKNGVIQSKYPTTKFRENLFLGTCFLSQPSVFFRRSIFERVGGLRSDLHYCLDYNLWLKFYLADANFVYLDKALSATRIYSETKTASGGDKFVNEILKMLLDEIGYIPINWKLYHEYSKEKKFVSRNNLSHFIIAVKRILLINPKAILEIVPYVIHIVKNRIKNRFIALRPPFGKHYSYIKSCR